MCVARIAQVEELRDACPALLPGMSPRGYQDEDLLLLVASEGEQQASRSGAALHSRAMPGHYVHALACRFHYTLANIITPHACALAVHCDEVAFYMAHHASSTDAVHSPHLHMHAQLCVLYALHVFARPQVMPSRRRYTIYCRAHAAMLAPAACAHLQAWLPSRMSARMRHQHYASPHSRVSILAACHCTWIMPE